MRIRKRIEEPFGWIKTVAGGRQKLQSTGLRHADDDGGPPTEAYRP